MGELAVFLALSAILCSCSLLVILARNPVSSAVSLVMALFTLAGLYAQMGADFIAVVQILLYTGAIVVLFLFVILLLNLSPEALRIPPIPPAELAVIGITMVSFCALAIYLFIGGKGVPLEIVGATTPEGNTQAVAMRLFQTYVWPFEIASILILLAIVAAVVIARKPQGRRCDSD